MEGKKLKSLLKFYKKRNEEVELKIFMKGGLSVRGKIVKLKCFFRRYLVLHSKDKGQMKIFLEDIIDDTVIPSSYMEKDKKNKINRTAIPPKLRFDVLKRDKYVCQYCGACGPNVELEIDHKIPVSKGGKDELDNLKTACIECNRGKGDIV